MLKTWPGRSWRTALLSSCRMKAAGFLAAEFIMWTCARTHRSCDERDLSKHSLALPQQSDMSNSMSTTVISITPMNCCIDRLLKLLIVTEDFLSFLHFHYIFFDDFSKFVLWFCRVIRYCACVCLLIMFLLNII